MLRVASHGRLILLRGKPTCGVVPGCTGPPSAPRAVWIASPSAQYVQLVGHPNTGDAHADNSAKAECERWSNAAVGLRNV